MTWSQTPVVTLNTFHDVFRSAAFQKIHPVGFYSQYCRSLSNDHNYTFFGAQYAQRKCPWGANPAFLIHLASDSRYRVGPQISLLPCWISFKQVGLASLSVTHPLGNTYQFHPCEGNPEVPDLARHEDLLVMCRARHTFLRVSPS